MTRTRLQPVELVPLGVLLAGGATLVIVTRGAIVPNTLQSTQALLITAGIAVAWALLAWLLLPRLVRSAALRSAIMTIMALGLIWVLVVPYFRPTDRDRDPAHRDGRALPGGRGSRGSRAQGIPARADGHTGARSPHRAAGTGAADHRRADGHRPPRDRCREPAGTA